MNKKEFFKMMAVIFLLGILFTPSKTNIWLYFFVPGIIFGILWFRKLD